MAADHLQPSEAVGKGSAAFLVHPQVRHYPARPSWDHPLLHPNLGHHYTYPVRCSSEAPLGHTWYPFEEHRDPFKDHHQYVEQAYWPTAAMPSCFPLALVNPTRGYFKLVEGEDDPGPMFGS